jgi:hypothetical protein
MKAEYVLKHTSEPGVHAVDKDIDKELDSPNISEIGSDISEEEIYEHVQEIPPTKKERY